MADLARLVVQIDSDGVVTAVKNLEDFKNKGKEVETGTQSMESHFAKLAEEMVSTAAVFELGMKVFEGFKEILAESVRLAIEAEQANLKLNAVLTATGDAAGIGLGGLKSLAEELANSTLFDDEKIKNAESLMLTFKSVVGDTFSQAMQDSADLAATFGMDLSSASVMLGKALEDPVSGLTALHRVGVSFSDDEKAMIKAMFDAGDAAGAQAAILKVLEGQVHGVASAMANSASGGMMQFQKAWDDLLKSIGAGIVQGLAPATDFLARWMKWQADAINTAMESDVQRLDKTVSAREAYGSKTAEILGPVDSLNSAHAISGQQYLSLIGIYPQLANSMTPYVTSLREALDLTKQQQDADKQKAVSGYQAYQGSLTEAIVSDRDKVKREMGVLKHLAGSDKNGYLTDQVDLYAPDGGISALEKIKATGPERNVWGVNDKISAIENYIRQMNGMSSELEATEKKIQAILHPKPTDKPDNKPVDYSKWGSVSTYEEALKTPEGRQLYLLRPKEDKPAAPEDYSSYSQATGGFSDLLGSNNFSLGPQTGAFGGITETRYHHGGENAREDDLMGQGFGKDKASQIMAMADAWKITDKSAAEFLGTMNKINASAQQLLGQGLAQGFQDIGTALANGTDAGEAFGLAMVRMGVQVAEQVGGLLIADGLKMLLEDSVMNPVGWAMIAAGGGLEMAGGYVGGEVSKASASQKVNDAIITKDGKVIETHPDDNLYAFKSLPGGGQGGGSTSVTVHNYSGAQVTTQERQGPQGRELMLMIGNAVNAHLANGGADKPMAGRYGVRYGGRSQS